MAVLEFAYDNSTKAITATNDSIISFSLYGGGGGGGGNDSHAGSYGVSGGTIHGSMLLKKDQTIYCTVGDGGSPGVSGRGGAAGGSAKGFARDGFSGGAGGRAGWSGSSGGGGQGGGATVLSWSPTGNSDLIAVAAGGGDVDDGGSLARGRQHRVDLVLHAQEDRLEVHVDHAVPVRLGQVGQVVDLELDRRGVDGEVEAAVGVHGGLDHGLDLVVPRHVRADEDRLAAGRLHEVDGLLPAGLRDITDDDPAAGRGEGEGDRPAHPPGSSGDDRGAALEPLVQVPEMGQGETVLPSCRAGHRAPWGRA